MGYLCVIYLKAREIYKSNYKNILLCDSKEELNSHIELNKQYQSYPCTYSEIEEFDGDIQETADMIAAKLNEAHYLILYNGYLYNGPEENNIYKITVKVKE